MQDIRTVLDQEMPDRTDYRIEFGGLYQKRRSFCDVLRMLLVVRVEFRSQVTFAEIVAKNGILMLDRVEHLRADGVPLDEALVLSGRRRLRPVLMTSLAAALGMLPLAYGIGSGADMLKPLAVGVMGALAVSVLLSLVATPAALAPSEPITNSQPRS